MSKPRKSDAFSGISFRGNEKTSLHPIDDVIPSSRLMVREINIDLIDPNPNQPRKYFDDIEELAQSINEKGVIEPIALKRIEQRYMIIFGERRWRASIVAGKKTIPAIIRDDYEDIEEISLIENLQRKDLSPLEESLAINRLVNNKGFKQKEVAVAIGKSEAYVSQAMKIAKFTEKYGNVEELINLKINQESLLGREHFLLVASQDSFEDGVTLLNNIVKGQMTVKKIRQVTKPAIWDAKKVINRLKHIRKNLNLEFVDNLSVKENKEKVLEDIIETQDKLRSAIEALEETKQKLNNVR